MIDELNKREIDIDKLLAYGFKKENSALVCSKKIENTSLEIVISYKNEFKIKVYDTKINEEYLGYKINNSAGAFSGQVKEMVDNLLEDIGNICAKKNNFKARQANRLTDYIKMKYNIEPVFMWDKYPDFGVFKKPNNKWFSIIMDIKKNILIKSADDMRVEIMNVKVDKIKLDDLLKNDGIYEAYHMNKKMWITILLDDTLDDDYIISLIDESYNLVK